MKRYFWAIGFLVAIGAIAQSPMLRSLGSISISGTPAANQVPIASSGSAASWGTLGKVYLGKVVTASSATSVDFSTISSGYTHLVVRYLARSGQAATATGMFVKINNDATSGDYTSTQYTFIQNTVTTSGLSSATSSGVFVNNISGTSLTSLYPSTGTVEFINYSNGTFYKAFQQTGSYGVAGVANTLLLSSATWISAAAINELTFNLSGQAFVDGSTFTLYGEP